jgi:hypothetical protein
MMEKIQNRIEINKKRESFYKHVFVIKYRDIQYAVENRMSYSIENKQQ